MTLSDDQFGAQQVGWMRTKDLRPTERFLDDAAPHMRRGDKPALRGYLDNMKSYVAEHGYPGPIEVKQYPGQGAYGGSGNRAMKKNTPMVMQGHHRRWIGLELKHEYVPVKLDRGSVTPSSFTTERPPGAPGIAPDPDVERTWMPESWGEITAVSIFEQRTPFRLRRTEQQGSALRPDATLVAGVNLRYDSALRSGVTTIPPVANISGNGILNTDTPKHNMALLYMDPIMDLPATDAVLGTWTELVVVRSQGGEPLTQHDGQFVARIVKADMLEPFTIEDTGLQGGRWIYYSVFARYDNLGAILWPKVGTGAVLVVKNYGYIDRFWSYTPEYLRDLDRHQAAQLRYQPEQGALYRFISRLGFEYDVQRTWEDSLGDLRDVEKLQAAVLPYLGDTLGLPYEPEVGDPRYRKLLANIMYLRSVKGSQDGIEGYLSALSGYEVEAWLGKNMMLQPADAIGGALGITTALDDFVVPSKARLARFGGWRMVDPVAHPSGTTTTTANYTFAVVAPTGTNAGTEPSALQITCATIATPGLKQIADDHDGTQPNPTMKAIPVIPGHQYKFSLLLKHTRALSDGRIGMVWGVPIPTSRNLLNVTTTPQTTISFDAATRTINRSSGSFVTNGFVAGQKVIVSGATNPENNGAFTVLTVAALTLTLVTGSVLVTAAAGPSITVQTVEYSEATGQVSTVGTWVQWDSGWITAPASANYAIPYFMPNCATSDVVQWNRCMFVDRAHRPITVPATVTDPTLTYEAPRAVHINVSPSRADLATNPRIIGASGGWVADLYTPTYVLMPEAFATYAGIISGGESSYTDLASEFDPLTNPVLITFDTANEQLIFGPQNNTPPWISVVATEFFPVTSERRYSARIQAKWAPYIFSGSWIPDPDGLPVSGAISLKFFWYVDPDPTQPFSTLGVRAVKVGEDALPSIAELPNAFVEFTHSNGQPTATAMYGRLAIAVSGTQGFKGFVKRVLIENKVSPGITYFDGGVNTGAPGDFAWVGTPHASTSVYYLGRSQIGDRLQVVAPSLVLTGQTVVVHWNVL